jgi:hypothetical protein
MLIKKTFVIALGMAIGLTARLAAADTQDKNISKFVPNASEVISTTVILTPPGLMTRAPLTENKLLEFGCNFTKETKSISKLIDIVKSDIQDDAGRVGKFYLRNAIYFKLKSGSRIRYVFSDTVNPDGDIFGGVDNYTTSSYVPFFAQDSLLVGLRSWVLDGSVEKKDTKWCTENK